MAVLPVPALSQCFLQLLVSFLAAFLGGCVTSSFTTEESEAQSSRMACFKSHKYTCRFLQSAFYVLGRHCMLLVTLTKVLQGRSFHSHFIDEETEPHRGRGLLKVTQRIKDKAGICDQIFPLSPTNTRDSGYFG